MCPEIPIQHIRHHAKYVWQPTVVDLIFKIDDDDRAKAVFDAGGCHSKILLGTDQAKQARMTIMLDIGRAECDLDQFGERPRRPFRRRKGLLVLGVLD